MITKQEMFNRSYLGLASQGFVRCRNWQGHCVYADTVNGQERHCGWGWVDKSLTNEIGDVLKMRTLGRGLAAYLTGEELDFARSLQSIHDSNDIPSEMKHDLIQLAQHYDLTVPEVP